MAHSFGQTLVISSRQTLAAAMEAAGYDGTHSLTYLRVKTGGAISLLVTEDGVSQPGTKQKMTATVVSPAGITSDGNGSTTITAAGMANSPITIPVPLTIVAHDSEDAIAEAFYDEIIADSDVTDFFTVTLDGNQIDLEAILPAANDNTYQFTIEDDTSAGITDDVTATQTTAGALNAGIVINNGTLELGDGSGVIIDSGLTWLIPTASPSVEIFARD